MGEVNYFYKEIDTADIWEYERDLVLSGKADLELAQEVLGKIESLLITHGKPSFGVQLYDGGDPDDQRYYVRKVNEYRDSLKSVEKLYRNEIFFCKHDCYSFNATYILTKENSDYEFFFTLKLRQYDNRISAIEDFFSFQIEKNFDNKESFLRFIKLCLRQYKHILSERVIITVQEWVEEQSPVVNSIEEAHISPVPQELSTKPKPLPVKTEIPDSFLLKGFIEDNEYFIKKVNEVMEVFQALKKGFISPDTKLDQFRAILSNKKIKPEDRIEWTGTMMELALFVRLLNKDLEKIAPIDQGIWKITINCFRREDNEIKETQLSKANGSKRNEATLISILNKL